MKLIRVFPRRTRATPEDKNVRIGVGPTKGDEADMVHISVSFTWDIPLAMYLEREWRRVSCVKVGGPAMGTKGKDFTPGVYLKPGYVITSRGCPNHCWFCSVWKRDGNTRELPIKEGWNILDDNILACSDDHIRKVFAMLARQKEASVFSGGLEAVRLKEWHAMALKALKPKSVFFAFDTPDDAEPLKRAGEMMRAVGFNPRAHVLRSYALIGFPGDTIARAEKRLRFILACGFTPMAMLYRDKVGIKDPEWRTFQRSWATPIAIYAPGRFEKEKGYEN